MATIFGRENNKKPVETSPIVTDVIGAGGEVISLKRATPLSIPDMATVTPISNVAGNNLPMVNFRDNKQYAGMKIIVESAVFTSGIQDSRVSDYVILRGFIYPPGQAAPTMDNAVLIGTGSGNIYDRIAEAKMNNSFPVSGMLRNAGRAWFID